MTLRFLAKTTKNVRNTIKAKFLSVFVKTRKISVSRPVRMDKLVMTLMINHLALILVLKTVRQLMKMIIVRLKNVTI